MTTPQTEPQLTVVVPTCRRPDLLALCLGRLAPGVQTMSADCYEVIVTDDGDVTAEQLVAQRFPWARWQAGPRRGPAANRNSGARAARGRWIAFTDDDCLPDRAWLAEFAAAAHEGCRVYEGQTTCAAGISSPLDLAPVNSTGGFLWSCNFFIERATFLAIGGFDEEFPFPHLEDVDFRERLVKAGYSFEFVPAAIVDHPPRRVAPGSRLGRYQESYVYYWYKCGNRKLVMPRLLARIVKTRIDGILRHKFNSATVQAAWSLAAELSIVLPRLPFWELKYRRRFLA